MTEVLCYESFCRWNNNGTCGNACIAIDDEGCQDYESYLDTEEYQNTYYIRVLASDGKQAKAIKKGKRIEYNGYVFFTDGCTNLGDDVHVTEERTGLDCGRLSALQSSSDRWEKFVAAASKESNCADLPLVEYDENTREYQYVREEARNEQN